MNDDLVFSGFFCLVLLFSLFLSSRPSVVGDNYLIDSNGRIGIYKLNDDVYVCSLMKNLYDCDYLMTFDEYEVLRLAE